MSLGLVGHKCGMTRVFTEHGESVPVSVVEILSNRVTQLKSTDSDGYHAVQISAGHQHRNRINKPMTGIYAKANLESGNRLHEFRLNDKNNQGNMDFSIGDELKATLFAAGQRVDVTGVTIGKGYAGTIKRHHFKSGDATHGNSLAHRKPGSTGQCQTPGKVHKGKRMAGQLGNVRRTVQNLEVVRVDEERNLLLIRGAVPGAKGGRLVIKPTTRVTKAAQ